MQGLELEPQWVVLQGDELAVYAAVSHCKHVVENLGVQASIRYTSNTTSDNFRVEVQICNATMCGDVPTSGEKFVARTE